jgi:23S rRNA pseudouridine2604 synthase
MNINKYLASQNYSTRRKAEALVKAGKVMINGKRATPGQLVNAGDVVEVVGHIATPLQYVAYNKPIGVATPERRQGLFPIGRLDKDSHGLLLLTNDGRLTDRLLNPDYKHEKEYVVETVQPLGNNFERRMSAPVHIGDEVTRRSKVHVLNDHTFSITLTEGKKHQIRRMCATLRYDIADLQRVRIMNIKLDRLPPNSSRVIKGQELAEFLASIGL